MKKKLNLIIFIIFIIQFVFSVKSMASTSYKDVQKAWQEVVNSYYMHGINIQYTTRKASLFPPEEATSQNLTYMVCSTFAKNINYDLLGIKEPTYTYDLIDYGKENIGSPEVVLYAGADANNNNKFTVFTYDKNKEGHISKDTTPTLEEIIPILKIGDVITYTGHTMEVYDLKYDSKGKVVDAYIVQTGRTAEENADQYYVKIKVRGSKVNIGDNISFGATGRRLKHNRSNGTSIVKESSGDLDAMVLLTETVWKDISTSPKAEYSILRFIQEDENGNAVLKYQGENYGDRNYDNEIINLSEKSKARLKYSKLYIEKTIDVHSNDIVEENEEITYKIVIKNNSEEKYSEDIKVIENLSEYVTYLSHEVKYNEKSETNNVVFTDKSDDGKLEWNIGKLASGDIVTINYKVKVKENTVGKTIQSTGTVGNIPSSIVKNTIGMNLTNENSIKEQFNELSKKYNGKELINEIYKKGFGIDLKLNEFEIKDLIKNNDLAQATKGSIELNENNAFYKMVLNKYWSTLYKRYYTYATKNDVVRYDLKNWGNYDDADRRADTIYGENFKTGDILVYINEDDNMYGYDEKKDEVTKKPVTFENGEYAYIYIEEKGFVGVNLGNDKKAGTQDDRNEFTAKYYSDNNLSVSSKSEETNEEVLEFANYQTLLGKDYYVILRPSLAVDITPMELNLSYSTTEPTNKDVTVTISSNEKMCEVKDWNLSEDKYTLIKTFNENITQLLKVYDNGGNERQVEIKINNIDKTVPSIKGIEPNKTYKEAVTPLIEEVNLKEIILYRDENVYEYKIGDVLKENGNYRIVVTDKAGNVSEMQFIIKIKGDVNGDGKLTVTDLIKIKRNIIGLEEFSEKEIKNGDLSEDGKITITDLLKMKRIIVGIEE